MREWTNSFPCINKIETPTSKFSHLLYVFFILFEWSLIQILLTLSFFSLLLVHVDITSIELPVYISATSLVFLYTYIHTYKYFVFSVFFYLRFFFCKWTRSAALYRVRFVFTAVCLYIYTYMCVWIPREKCLTKVKMLNLANRWSVNK